MTRNHKLIFLGTLVTVLLVAVFALVPPIAQDPAYHAFADARTMFGIPNFLDVASNLPFIPVGLYGLWLMARDRDNPLRIPLAVFFAGVVIVAPGSAYYHLTPDNPTLFWDRLPMTVAFMGFLAAVVAERIDRGFGIKVALPVLIALGIWSAVHWKLTEEAGAGDLRAYALVQFLPMLLIPLMVWMFPKDSARIGWREIAWVLAFYLLAKVLEHFDSAVFELTGGLIAGHAPKHVAASLAPLALALLLKKPSP